MLLRKHMKRVAAIVEVDVRQVNELVLFPFHRELEHNLKFPEFDCKIATRTECRAELSRIWMVVLYLRIVKNAYAFSQLYYLNTD